mgnify:CR=1 FL=1
MVFGAPVLRPGHPSRPLVRRLQTALMLAQTAPHLPVVLTGKGRLGPNEASTMADWLRARGIGAGRLIVEAASRDTCENVRFALPLLRQAGIRRVHVVTDPFHVPRCVALLRAAARLAGMQMTVVAHPTGHRLSWRRAAKLHASELLKLPLDLLRLVWLQRKQG